MSPETKDREQKALRFADFCVRRLKFGQTEDQIANGLGFESPEALYSQLERDGSPVCGVCGQLYPDPDHQKEHKRQRKRKPKPGTGRLIELPPATDAYKLFREALKRLDSFIGLLRGSKEWIQDEKRFIQAHYDPNSWETIERDQLSQAEWEKICEQHDLDPTIDRSTLPERFAIPIREGGPLGIERTPSLPLTRLIAAYMLSGLPRRDLLKVLHRDPESVLPDILTDQQDEELWWDEDQGEAGEVVSEEWEKLSNKVDELYKIAGHVAVLVRGGTLGGGSPIEEISSYEHLIAWKIRDLLKREGLSSNEELYERLSATSKHFRENCTIDDVHRLRYLGLRPPEHWNQ